MGGRRWTVKEVSALRFFAAVARDHGLDTGGRPRRGSTGMLRAVALMLGRSYGAVLHKASQLGVHASQRRRPLHNRSHRDEGS